MNPCVHYITAVSPANKRGAARVHAWPTSSALTDLGTPWCVHVVATCGSPTTSPPGVDGVDELAAAAGCDADALRRVLGHLVGQGVFAEPAPGRFALNDAGRGLLDPRSAVPRPRRHRRPHGPRLGHAARPTSGPARRPTASVFGLPFWEDLDAHPDVAASFDALMGPAGHGAPDPEVLLDGRLGRGADVVDVGGGTGAMLAEILRARPGRPRHAGRPPGTVARAAATFEAAGVADRVDARRAELLRPAAGRRRPLPAAASVLNDWPDREATAILRRCAEAARPAAAWWSSAAWRRTTGRGGLDVEMVLLGGKSGRLAEFRELAGAAGLEVVGRRAAAVGSFVVECRPA